MLTILADENIPAVEHYAGDLGTVRRTRGRDLRAEQLAGVDVLLVRSVTVVDESLLGRSNVCFVGSATSGLEHIDRDYLQRRGIGFAHAPGSNANSVVEYVLVAIAATGTRLEQLLAGARVGIVGYGVIGKAMAARLRALDIDYRVYDPWLAAEVIEQSAELADILACDVVTLHPELTLQQPWPSHHLLDRPALAQLRRDALLVNASRGAVVDNKALLSRLAAGHGPDTVLDVWEGEPAIKQPLLERVNLGTAHIAGYSLDGKLLATQMLCEAMVSQLGLDWHAPPGPVGEAMPLEAPEGLEGAALLRYLLNSRYDIARDDEALRAATLDRDTARAAAGFDQLRRDYPPRRELFGSKVYGRSFSPQDLDLLKALGCAVLTGDNTW